MSRQGTCLRVNCAIPRVNKNNSKSKLSVFAHLRLKADNLWLHTVAPSLPTCIQTTITV